MKANRELAPERAGLKEADASFPKLPTEMHEALAALAADTALVEAIGPEFVRVFTTVKNAELSRMREDIPAVETNEYFELY